MYVCVCVCVCIKPHMHTYIFKVWLNYNFLISSEKSFYFSIVSIILDKQTKKKKTYFKAVSNHFSCPNTTT